MNQKSANIVCKKLMSNEGLQSGFILFFPALDDSHLDWKWKYRPFPVLSGSHVSLYR